MIDLQLHKPMAALISCQAPLSLCLPTPVKSTVLFFGASLYKVTHPTSLIHHYMISKITRYSFWCSWQKKHSERSFSNNGDIKTEPTWLTTSQHLAQGYYSFPMVPQNPYLKTARQTWFAMSLSPTAGHLNMPLKYNQPLRIADDIYHL